MEPVGVILNVLAGLALIGAILYQRLDYSKGYGSTMGGQMTAGMIWSLAALLCGLGTGIVLTWYWGCAAFIAVYISSFGVRTVVERVFLYFDRRM